MRSIAAAALLLALLVLSSVPAMEAAFAGEGQPPPPPAVVGEDIDIKLPLSSPLISQWIVVVDGGRMQIVPAKTRTEDDGIVVTATVPQISQNSLRAAVATAQDGSIISTELKAGKR